MTTIATGELDGRIVPYVRTTRASKYNDRNRKYAVSLKKMRWFTKLHVRNYEGPWGLEVTLHLPERKAGGIPRNEGDLDNYAKAVADALQGHTLPDDVLMTELVARKVRSDEPRVAWRAYSTATPADERLATIQQIRALWPDDLTPEEFMHATRGEDDETI